MKSVRVFNHPIESALRSLVLLVEAFPRPLHLTRLVQLDYLLIHSGDFGGPSSIHPPLPLRIGEVLVRRKVVYDGLLQLVFRGLAAQIATTDGLMFIATEESAPGLAQLSNVYVEKLKDRSNWIAEVYNAATDEELSLLFKKKFNTDEDLMANEFLIHDGDRF